MTLQTNITSAFIQVGTEFNKLRKETKELIETAMLKTGAQINDTLSNSAKETWSINKISQVLSEKANKQELSNLPKISDNAVSPSSTWSSQKTQSEIKKAVDGIIEDAPEALNTLKEIADKLQEDESTSQTVLRQIANIGPLDHSFVNDFTSALSNE